jgi:hypothetical protein
MVPDFSQHSSLHMRLMQQPRVLQICQGWLDITKTALKPLNRPDGMRTCAGQIFRSSTHFARNVPNPLRLIVICSWCVRWCSCQSDLGDSSDRIESKINILEHHASRIGRLTFSGARKVAAIMLMRYHKSSIPIHNFEFIYRSHIYCSVLPSYQVI